MKKLKYYVYRVIYQLVKLFYPKMQIIGKENLPDEPCLIVGNHAQMHGPIATELYFPGKHYIWCIGEMMHLKEVPAYAYQDFWSKKPRCIRWFYRLLSYIIAPFSVCIFTNAHTIPVYRDARVKTTMKKTVNHLRDGAHVIIFPEHNQPHNHILCDFQDGFVNAARSYYHLTGKEVSFIPLYMAPSLKTMCLGKPIPFHADVPIKEERRRICDELMKAITDMAESLPKHRVVPYNNVSKKEYPYNFLTEAAHEKTSC